MAIYVDPDEVVSLVEMFHTPVSVLVQEQLTYFLDEAIAAEEAGGTEYAQWEHDGFTFPNGFDVDKLSDRAKASIIHAVRETIYEQLKECSCQNGETE